VNPFHYSPLPFPSQSPFSNRFQYILLYPLPILCFMILLTLSLFLSSFPELHKVDTLLQTCSTCEFIYPVWFCVYAYLLDLSSTNERKHTTFVFLSLAYFIYHDVLQLYPLTFKPHSDTKSI
jgi:hypothetical protein